jgi:hypothetical protein
VLATALASERCTRYRPLVEGTGRAGEGWGVRAGGAAVARRVPHPWQNFVPGGLPRPQLSQASSRLSEEPQSPQNVPSSGFS